MTDYLGTLAARAIASPDTLQLQPRLGSAFEDGELTAPLPVESQREFWGEEETQHVGISIETRERSPRPRPKKPHPLTVPLPEPFEFEPESASIQSRPIRSTAMARTEVSAPPEIPQTAELPASHAIATAERHTLSPALRRDTVETAVAASKSVPHDESPAISIDQPAADSARGPLRSESPKSLIATNQREESALRRLLAHEPMQSQKAIDADVEQRPLGLQERTIRISICRVDVRPIVVPSTAKRAEPNSPKPFPLDEYLKQRDTRK
jgi:hypothetical protein